MTFQKESLAIKIYVIVVTLAAVIFSVSFPTPKVSDSFCSFFIIMRIFLEHYDVLLPDGNGSIQLVLPLIWQQSSCLGQLLLLGCSSTVIHKRAFTH